MLRLRTVNAKSYNYFIPRIRFIIFVNVTRILFMSKYDYSDSELELMKVLKMQEMELSATSEAINETSDSIAKIKEDISAMACARGVDISTLHHEKIFAEKFPQMTSRLGMSW